MVSTNNETFEVNTAHFAEPPTEANTQQQGHNSATSGAAVEGAIGHTPVCITRCQPG